MNHDLLQHPDLIPILGILRKAPFEIRLVGGAVRDSFLGRGVHDFDFAAACTFQEMRAFLTESPCDIARENDRHGSILFTYQGHGYDMTVLRQDVETDGRHARIITTDSWLLDARRRDFTINALSMSLDGECFDPLEQGIRDLENRHLRFIGDIRRRIQEDYLRILRFFRFQAQLGFAFNQDDLTIIAEEASFLRQLSKERIRTEIRQILSLPEQDVLHTMTNCQIWSAVFPISMPGNLGFLTKFYHPEPDWILRLAAWFRDIPQAKQEIPYALAFSKTETRRFQQYLSRPELPINPALWLYRYGRALSVDYFWLYGDQREIPDSLTCAAIPIFPITSADLSALGCKGAQLGSALRKAESLWIDSGMKLQREALVKSVRNLF